AARCASSSAAGKLVIVVASIISGAALLLAQRAAGDMPGRVDANGHALRMRIAGDARPGSPTVVFEIGLGGALEEWAVVQGEVARFARTFAYDRIGSNYALGVPLTGVQIADELREALQAAHVEPPYILVGQ